MDHRYVHLAQETLAFLQVFLIAGRSLKAMLFEGSWARPSADRDLARFKADFSLPCFQDLLNDLFACGFLVGAVVFAVTSRKTMPVHYAIAVVSLLC